MDAPRRTALDPALRHYAQLARRPGLLFLLSDLFGPGDSREGLTTLLARGYELVLLHLLSPDEAAPELSGDLKLIDVETVSYTHLDVYKRQGAVYVLLPGRPVGQGNRHARGARVW